MTLAAWDLAPGKATWTPQTTPGLVYISIKELDTNILGPR